MANGIARHFTLGQKLLKCTHHHHGFTKTNKKQVAHIYACIAYLCEFLCDTSNIFFTGDNNYNYKLHIL
jgi:hypothetical protein